MLSGLSMGGGDLGNVYKFWGVEECGCLGGGWVRGGWQGGNRVGGGGGRDSGVGGGGGGLAMGGAGLVGWGRGGDGVMWLDAMGWGAGGGEAPLVPGEHLGGLGLVVGQSGWA